MRRSDSHFGLTDKQWSEAKAEARAIIIGAARDRRMTHYSEVADGVTVIHLDPYSSLMNHLLGAIFEEDRGSGGPALTSIVTHKSGDLEPGVGFYEMARNLGYRVAAGEEYLFWAEQVQGVFTRYGKGASR